MSQQPQDPVIKGDEVNDWMERVRGAVAKPDTITGPAGHNARPWYSDFFGCFNPIDTCLVTYFCPCVTFGKTHHRLRKDSKLSDWNPVNTTCLGFWAASCFCLHWVPQIIQRREIQDRWNLQGDFVTDCLKVWCCGCCDVIQQDKEVAHRLLEEGGESSGAERGEYVQSEPKPVMMQDGGMVYPTQPQPVQQV